MGSNRPIHSHISPFYSANDVNQIVASRRFVGGRFAKEHSLPQFGENPETHGDPGADVPVAYRCDETGFDSPNLQNLISPPTNKACPCDCLQNQGTAVGPGEI